jgi:5-methylcytosine-specific restriction endonuclease McrA
MTRFCPKCQVETERYASGGCKVCVKAYSAARRAADPEKNKATSIAWAAANPERKKANNKAWNLANLEKLKAIKAAWVLANPERNKIYRSANLEKIAVYQKAYYASNQEKLCKKTKNWKKNNPHKVKSWLKSNPEVARLHNQNYRAKKRINGGILSKGFSAKLFKLQKGKCPCCHQPLGENYHLDHIVPLALGGSNTDDNIQLLRQKCNQQKHAKHPIDFMQQRGFLL